MEQVIVNALVAFAVTGAAKAQTRLNGTRWLILVNFGVSLLASLCDLWATGSPTALEGALTVAVNTAVSAGIAWLTHRIVKPGYRV